MTLILIRYAYDIYVNVPDDYTFVTVSGKDEAWIRCVNRKGANIFSYKENEYKWISDKQEGYLYATIFDIDDNDKATPLRHVISSESEIEFNGGTIDTTTYTIFEVLFRMEGTSVSEAELSELQARSINILRIFIEKYRYISQENDIIVPDMEDFILIEYLQAKENKAQSNEVFDLEFKKITQTYNWEKLRRKRLKKRPMTENDLILFTNQLKSGVDLQLYEKLLLEAKEQAYVHKAYEMSILKSETAFEVYIQNLLILLCEKNNINELLVGKRQLSYEEAILNGNIRETLIKVYLRPFVKESIAGTKEYNTWYDDCYTLRNEIIHRGLSHDLTNDDAGKAFESVYLLIRYIGKMIKEKSESLLL